MNFLAHAFLSPDSDKVLLGNFFGDSFKGRPEKHGPQEIVDGIRLHRSIDHFTDNHPIVKQATELFREQQKRLAPAVVDMIFDHLLARSFNLWSPTPLSVFTNDVFKRLDSIEHHIPNSAQVFYPHMRKHNWLLQYRNTEGLRQALAGMDRRFGRGSAMVESLEILRNESNELDMLFTQFFRELIGHARDQSLSIR